MHLRVTHPPIPLPCPSVPSLTPGSVFRKASLVHDLLDFGDLSFIRGYVLNINVPYRKREEMRGFLVTHQARPGTASAQNGFQSLSPALKSSCCVPAIRSCLSARRAAYQACNIFHSCPRRSVRVLRLPRLLRICSHCPPICLMTALRASLPSRPASPQSTECTQPRFVEVVPPEEEQRPHKRSYRNVSGALSYTSCYLCMPRVSQSLQRQSIA